MCEFSVRCVHAAACFLYTPPPPHTHQLEAEFASRLKVDFESEKADAESEKLGAKVLWLRLLLSSPPSKSHLELAAPCASEFVLLYQ